MDLRERRDINRRLLMDMNNSLAHRGPDGEGYHFEPGVALGHRRLSIIDLDGGKQPMYNEDDSVAIVFNGEIYDYQGLRADLQRRGHSFATKCDTETIVHAWEEWGTDCLHHLKGMFAFAIWDRHRKELFLARDRFGKKPLYYSFLSDGHFIFSSELKALMLHPSLERKLDRLAIHEYLTFGYIPDPRSIYESVRKLEAGHYLLLRHGETPPSPKKYWDVSFDCVDPHRSEAEIGAELMERFDSSVARRMIADVSLGAFLSGGVDSSAVVTSMSKVSDESVRTCSISFGDPKYNEAAYARQVASSLCTDHHVERVDTDDFGLIDDIAYVYDEPFADSSALPTYRVCELARKHVTVALSGDGGDEVFAGYRRHRWHMNEQLVRSRMPGFLRRPIFRLAGAVYPKMDWAPRIFRAKSTLEAIARDSVDAYLHSVSVLPNDLQGKLYSNEFRSQLQGYSSLEVFWRHLDNCDSEDPLSQIQYLDMKTYLPGDILTKVDRASMAHGLEVRAPLLDTDFTQWVCSLPSGLKIHRGEGKYIFKKALEGRVDKNILYRDKMGFAVPLASWFRGPLRDDVRQRLLGDRLADSRIFDMAQIRSILDSHFAGRRDYSPPIWALLMLERFLDRNDR